MRIYPYCAHWTPMLSFGSSARQYGLNRVSCLATQYLYAASVCSTAGDGYNHTTSVCVSSEPLAAGVSQPSPATPETDE